MLLGDAFEQRGEAVAAADDLQEALACSSLLAPLMPARARLIASYRHMRTFLPHCSPLRCEEEKLTGHSLQ